MQRRHSKGDLAAIKKHRKDREIAALSSGSYFRDMPDGKMRKMHPLDCGKPNCAICDRQDPKGFSRKENALKKENLAELEK